MAPGATAEKWIVTCCDDVVWNCIYCQFNIIKHINYLLCFIIIVLGISFMQGIYTYVPEANHVPREHCVATILM
jgi:hypothetical protein